MPPGSRETSSNAVHPPRPDAGRVPAIGPRSYVVPPGTRFLTTIAVRTSDSRPILLHPFLDLGRSFTMLPSSRYVSYNSQVNERSHLSSQPLSAIRIVRTPTLT